MNHNKALGHRTIFKLGLALMRNHPDMYDEFTHMANAELEEFLRENYGVVLKTGTSWEEVNVIVEVMNKMYEAKNSA